jgi:hypothetical protein
MAQSPHSLRTFGRLLEAIDEGKLHAAQLAVEAVEEVTGLPVFFGTPEQ